MNHSTVNSEAAQGPTGAAELLECRQALQEGHGRAPLGAYDPAPYIMLPQHGGDPRLWARAEDQGEALLRSGQVAVLTLAGGLGSRLGYPRPKGLLSLETPQGSRTLFGIFAEKLLATKTKMGQQPLWILLTSKNTHSVTENFFKKERFFGLNPQKVFFITQGNLPLLSPQGDLLRQEDGSLYEAPDGHGGFLEPLRRSGLLERLGRDGVKHLSLFQVDNPLSPFLEPAFLGLHESAHADMSCRVVVKEDPKERLGLFCLDGHKPRVIEYLEVPPQAQAERSPTGALRLCCGNLGLYLLRIGFLFKTSEKLPLHTIPTTLNTPDPQNPTGPKVPIAAIKFERYLFDLLPLAQRQLLVEADRALAFAPIKEPHGPFGPLSAQKQLSLLAK